MKLILADCGGREWSDGPDGKRRSRSPASGSSPPPRWPNRLPEFSAPARRISPFAISPPFRPTKFPRFGGCLEQDLKAHGVTTTGAESANLHSRDAQRERARAAVGRRVVEGNETRVAMVHVDRRRYPPAASEWIVLRSKRVWTLRAAIGCHSAWRARAGGARDNGRSGRPGAGADRSLTDSIVERLAGAERFNHRATASLPAIRAGSCFRPPTAWLHAPSPQELRVHRRLRNSGDDGRRRESGWSVHCHAERRSLAVLRLAPTRHARKAQPRSKPSTTPRATTSPAWSLPSLGVDLPPFYSAALLPAAGSGAALLFNGIDGKVQLVENGALKPVSRHARLGQRFCGAQLRLRRGHADRRLRLRRSLERQPARLRVARARGHSGQRAARRWREP